MARWSLLTRPRWVRVAIVAANLPCAFAAFGAGERPDAFVAPAMPAACSAIVPPELTAACPITAPGVDSLVVKGRGVAFNGVSFGDVGTGSYILAEASAHASASDACAATIVDLKMQTLQPGFAALP